MNTLSIQPNEFYQVLDVVQATHADLSVSDGLYKIGNPLKTVGYFKDFASAKITAPVAEQLQVTTLTPVAAANSTYSFYITQYDPASGNMRTWQYSYETPASGATATTIGDFFRTAINADTTIHIAATGTATLILTAEAGYPVFQVGIVSVGGGLTQATGTAGIPAVNTVAMLTAQGFLGLTGATYTTVQIKINARNTPLMKNPQATATVYDLLINQGATNRAALVTAITEALGNLIVDGTTASIEGFALV